MDVEAIKRLEAKLSADQEEIAKNLDALRRVKSLLGDIEANESEASAVETAAGGCETEVAAKRESSGRLSLGVVDDAVRWAVSQYEGMVFDSTGIKKTLESAGKHCNPSSVSAALGRLRDKGILLVVEKGQGRRPTKYKPA